MQLPIELVPNTNPPRFRWKYVVDTPNGKQVVNQEGSLQPSMEVAMERMISIAKQLLLSNAALQGRIDALEEKLAEPAGPVIPARAVTTVGKKGRG